MQEIETALSRPLISRKSLRRIAGRGAWTLGFVPVLRSFLDSVWAVLADLESHKPPSERDSRGGDEQFRPKAARFRRLGDDPATQTKRVEESLLWLRAFLSGLVGSEIVGREIDVRECAAQPGLRITADASPWGVGAVLERHGVPVAYLADAISADDARKLSIEIGSCRGQAPAEALAILVALRTWVAHWRGKRLALQVRSDSTAALGALGKFGSPSPAVNKVARELSIDVALSAYGVDVWSHLPAESNVEADALSRWFEPGVTPAVPPRLVHVERSFPAPRGDAWWCASSAAWQRRIRVEAGSCEAESGERQRSSVGGGGPARGRGDTSHCSRAQP